MPEMIRRPRWVERWAAEERRDVDAIMALYDPDASYEDAGGRVEGLVRSASGTSARWRPIRG